MPNTATKEKGKWKAKYQGKWYDVEDVEDMGVGKQNVYHLKGVGPVEKIEDLDIAASTSFLGKVAQVQANADFFMRQLRTVVGDKVYMRDLDRFFQKVELSPSEQDAFTRLARDIANLLIRKW